MNILSVHHLTKTFGERVLFDRVCFDVPERGRIGLVGVNGCGKTTLLRILTGQESHDSGDVALQKGRRIGYMAQHAAYTASHTLYEQTLQIFAPLMECEQELEQIRQQIEFAQRPLEPLVKRQAALTEQYQAQGGLTYRARTRSTLLGMGFEEADLSLPMHALSGGQHSKAQMAQLLLSGADLLLLDEPTNHLDIQSVEWLENYLIGYPGALLIISHDRYFLDRVTTGTLELEHQRITAFNGGYSAYLQHKQRQRDIEAKHYKTAQKEIKRMEDMITEFRRWNRERSVRTAESKEKQLAKLKQSVKKPESAPPAIRFQIDAQSGGGQDVLMAKGLSKSFDKPLFSKVDIHIRKGERVFLLGPNGCGKTTLFQILLGRLLPDQGDVQLGAQIRIGYYDQTQSSLRPDGDAFSAIADAFPSMNQTQIRSSLAAFLFRGDDVFKPIVALSGGERARIELLKLMLSQANFLLLDEPTNHLDAPSREALERALLDYEGTIFAISHDRYLVNRLATRVLSLTPQGLDESIGNYDDYLRHQQERRLVVQNQANPAPAKAPSESKERRENAAALRRARAQLRKAEDTIERWEEQIHALEQQLAQPEIACDYEQTLALTEQLHQAQEELEQTMEQWESLSLLLEQAGE